MTTSTSALSKFRTIGREAADGGVGGATSSTRLAGVSAAGSDDRSGPGAGAAGGGPGL